MNCERRLFILSLVLSVGLVSGGMVHADYSITERCAALLVPNEGGFRLFQTERVNFFNRGQIVPSQVYPCDVDGDDEHTDPITNDCVTGTGETDPVLIDGFNTFCEDLNQDGKIDPADGEFCERTGLWSGAEMISLTWKTRAEETVNSWVENTLNDTALWQSVKNAVRYEMSERKKTGFFCEHSAKSAAVRTVACLCTAGAADRVCSSEDLFPLGSVRAYAGLPTSAEMGFATIHMPAGAMKVL